MGSFLVLIAILIIIALAGLLNMMTINDGMTAMYYARLIPLSQIASEDDEWLAMRGDSINLDCLAGERAISEYAL